jgi:hypothetical protein
VIRGRLSHDGGYCSKIKRRRWPEKPRRERKTKRRKIRKKPNIERGRE